MYNGTSERSAPNHLNHCKVWWAVTVSNRRHSRCKRAGLTPNCAFSTNLRAYFPNMTRFRFHCVLQYCTFVHAGRKRGWPLAPALTTTRKDRAMDDKTVPAKGWDEKSRASFEQMKAEGYIVNYTGKMVSDHNGGFIEQVIVTHPEQIPSQIAHRPLPALTNIYFIGSECGPIKIGMAQNVNMRLRALQLAGPSKLTVLATVLAPPSEERDYHKQFAAHRLHGEWFSPHPDILAEITRLTTGGARG